MKWLTFLIGVIIVVGGVWLVFSPQSADSPETQELEEGSMMEEGDMKMEGGESVENGHDGGAMMEDGTIKELDKSSTKTQVEVEASGSTSSFAVQEEPQGDPIFHALVEYTDEGFSPATLSIKSGETVRFINNSSQGVWIGGDNHPSHTIYPEKTSSDCLGTAFDTCRALQSGEFWEFTFNSVGSWGYHNHVRAREGGTIVVN